LSADQIYSVENFILSWRPLLIAGSVDVCDPAAAGSSSFVEPMEMVLYPLLNDKYRLSLLVVFHV
jgi:hypothetical protein